VVAVSFYARATALWWAGDNSPTNDVARYAPATASSTPTAAENTAPSAS